MGAPVGLVGKLSISTFERGVMRVASSSARSAKPSAACVGTATGTPCASAMLGLYDT